MDSEAQAINANPAPHRNLCAGGDAESDVDRVGGLELDGRVRG